MTIKVNVKSKGENALGVGYSFKVNEISAANEINVSYLPENKVKKAIIESDKMKDLHLIPSFGFAALIANNISNIWNNQMVTLTVNGSVTTIKHINLMKQLHPIITLIQDLALPVSIVIGCWACIEWIIGSPGWKHKIKGATIGLVGIYIIPYIFEAISGALGTLGM